MKTCKCCTLERDEEDFRPYYKGKKGTYKHCVFCEKILTRYKYLTKLVGTKAQTEAQSIELAELKKLFCRFQEHGGVVPLRTLNNATSSQEIVKDMLAKLQDREDINK